MQRILIAAFAIAVMVVPAYAQLIGQPSGQGGVPSPPPNVSSLPPSVPNTSVTPQLQDPALQLPSFSTEQQSLSRPDGTPSPRVRALNSLTRSPTLGSQGQAERPAGPLR
jgi:hypothetical protein